MASVVLAREDEPREPEVGQQQIQREQIALVILERRTDGAEKIKGQRQDCYDLGVD